MRTLAIDLDFARKARPESAKAVFRISAHDMIAHFETSVNIVALEA